MEFANQQTLELLFIHQSDISDATLARIGSSCNVEELVLSDCPEISARGVQAMLTTGSIRRLTIDHCGHITGDLIPALCRAPQLEELSLHGVELTEAATRRLSECQQLKRLTLDAHRCSAETAEWMQNVIPSLTVTRKP